jgi:hypothetical protein
VPYDAKTVGFYGDVRTGKTTAALAEALAEAGAAALPLVIVDSLGSQTFDTLRQGIEVRSLRELCVRAWRLGRHALWVPRTADQVEALASVAFDMGHAGRSCVLLIDETSPWFSAYLRPERLTLLFRAHRHCRVSIFLTTQYLGDLSPAYMQCVEKHRVFRNSSPRALQRIRDAFPGMDVAKVAKLPVGSHLDYPPK